jgi:hypothetical protein
MTILKRKEITLKTHTCFSLKKGSNRVPREVDHVRLIPPKIGTFVES